MSEPDFAPTLQAAVTRAMTNVASIANLRRLSGGASQETWSFDGVGPHGTQGFVLRRAPGGKVVPRSATAVPLATEAKVIRLAGAAGVPVPPVPYVLQEADNLGPGYVMGRVEGETIARKILRDAAFADARPKLARQCGRILAGIHAIETKGLDELAVVPPRAQFDPPLTLVHGDFRHGNLMIGPDGVRAVLDWELTHIGDPAEDLGWICVNSWRFGLRRSRRQEYDGRTREVLGDLRHDEVGHHVHDDVPVLRPRLRPQRRARNDRPPLLRD
jgi:aminoglycoside phosphotransferase (APT) family kinase protein